MVSEQKFLVEVAYAKPQEQVIIEVESEPGVTAEQAIDRSGILERFPEIDLSTNKIGVFGKAATLAQELHAGDRVEIYRSLIADPKEARRRRAAEGKAMRKGGDATSNENKGAE